MIKLLDDKKDKKDQLEQDDLIDEEEQAYILQNVVIS